MSGFWTTSDNDDATRVGNEYDAGGGNFEPLPDGSVILAMPEEAKWETVRDRSEEYIGLKWTVLAPKEYANRKINQKLFVTDDDPNVTDRKKMETKRDKAKRMLAAIDANAGGKLARSAKKPDDQDLAVALTGKQMVIRLGVWEMTNRNQQTGNMETNSGNWVQACYPKGARDIVVPEAPAKAAASQSPSRGNSSSFSEDLDDEIPF